MKLAVLRVSGRSFDVVALLNEYEIEGATVRRAGEPDRRGHPREESGLTLTVVDAATNGELRESIRFFLENRRAFLEALRRLGVRAELDIGVVTGTEGSFTASVVLEAPELAALAAAGIAVRFSAYPGAGP